MLLHQAADGLMSCRRRTGLRQEVNDLLRAGPAAIDRPRADSGERYQLPTFDPDRALIEDHRVLER